MKELDLPLGVEASQDADELVRFWIADGDELVSLNVGMLGADEASQWGMILADLSIHIVRALKQRGDVRTEELIRADIERGYLGRLEAKSIKHAGSLLGARN